MQSELPTIRIVREELCLRAYVDFPSPAGAAYDTPSRLWDALPRLIEEYGLTKFVLDLGPLGACKRDDRKNRPGIVGQQYDLP